MGSLLYGITKNSYEDLIRNIARVMMRRIDEDMVDPIIEELKTIPWNEAVNVTENLMRMGSTILKNSLWQMLLEEIQKVRVKMEVLSKYSPDAQGDGAREYEGDKDVTSAFIKCFMLCFSLRKVHTFKRYMDRIADINARYGDKPEYKKQAISEFKNLFYELEALPKNISTAELEALGGGNG